VTHYSRVAAIVVDAPPDQHDAQLAFWQGAVGRDLPRFTEHPEYHGAQLPGHSIELLVQRLGEGAARVHLDIQADDVDAEVARLEALGATRVVKSGSWQVLRDPAGLVFCVVPARPGLLSDSNAQRWD
jgi:hypothetical protein